MQMTLEEWLQFFEKEDVYAFCAKIAENPDDLAPKLVFADWLEENCPVNSFPENYRKHLSGEHPKLQYPFSERSDESILFYQGRLFVAVHWGGSITVPIQQLCRSGIVCRLEADGDEIDVIQEAFPLLHSLIVIGTFCWDYAERGFFAHVTDFSWERDSSLKPDRRVPYLLSTDYCKQLSSLGFRTFFLNGTDIEALAHFPNPPHLKQLTFQNLFSTGESFIGADKFNGLETLICLCRRLVNNEFLTDLANKTSMTSLRELRLDLGDVDSHDWEHFFQARHFASLRVLELEKIPNEMGLFRAIAQSPYLAGLGQLRLSQLKSVEAKKLLAESPYLSESIKRQFQF